MTYAFDDYLLARLSQLVGDAVEADAAMQRSNNVLNVWQTTKEQQEKMGYICPRNAAGDWDCPPSATSAAAWRENIEGDAFHWGLFWTQNPATFIPKLFPSQQAFVDQLEEYFVKHVAAHEKLGSAVPNPYYWAGNEISSFTPFLFAYSSHPGACTRTQYWSRRLSLMHYSNTPHGLPGNDDYGSMSTWFIFATLGMFPRAGSTDFVLGSPRVNSATISLRKYPAPGIVQLKITAHDNSPDNVYVIRALFNGVELKSPIIDRSLLMNGGEIEFFMGPTSASNLCR
jgi:putative alpha-1,2-mannosidase